MAVPSSDRYSTEPLVIFARVPCSTRRMIDRAVTDLPEPDSPTMARVSPDSMLKEAELTAMKSSNLTVRSVTDRSAMLPA